MQMSLRHVAKRLCGRGECQRRSGSLDVLGADAEMVVGWVADRVDRVVVCGLTRTTRVHVGDRCSSRSMT